jgi:hypothetical protein
MLSCCGSCEVLELEVESSHAISGSVGLGGGSAILKWISMPKHGISSSEQKWHVEPSKTLM